jgi:hypothetical protein
VAGVPAPEARRRRHVDEADGVGDPVPFAEPVGARAARVTGPAGEEHLDGDPVPDPDAPAFECRRPRLLDDADHLVTGNELEGGPQMSGVLLVVGPAETARFDPQEAVVVPDLGERKPALLEVAGLAEDRDRGLEACHQVTIR